MWLSVKHVQATDDHKLILTFENSEKRCLDVSQFFEFGRFAELKDIYEFKKVRVVFDTIEWENERHHVKSCSRNHCCWTT